MAHVLPSILFVLAVIAAVAWAGRRLEFPVPVLLAVAGFAWSLFPGLAAPEIEPGIVLAVFLPPLLYADAWNASWIDFRRWLRPILQLAIGLVAFTIVTVGVVAKMLMPELPWAACFLLGAIVSPTDTVAVHAVLERLRITRRATAILGGESLVNDATGLLGVSLATVVVASGMFEAGEIGIRFASIAGLGVAVGVAVGLGAAWLNCRARGTEILVTLSLLAPYVAYFVAETVGASGVLAVVIAGFVASWREHVIAPESRVELYAVWGQLVFLLNALMFLFVGLETPHRLSDALTTMPGLIGSALIVALVVIASRFAWVFPGAYVPLILSERLRRLEQGYPPPRYVLIAAWCGVRGAVSLAAALSIPPLLADGTPFPGREQIVACTLVVILVTLVGQGLTLGPLVRALGVSAEDPSDAEVRAAREAMLAAGIARLDAYCTEESCPIAVYRLRDAMSDELATLKDTDATERTRAERRLAVAADVRREVYRAQAAELLRLRDGGALNDRAHQQLQMELDRANHG
ncbi:MAG TPA: Na+/H+ antiporter [Candidatus Polarisedimenticolaceae bacterium]